MSRLLQYRAPNFSAKEVETVIYNLELKPEVISQAARPTRDGQITNPELITVQEKTEIWNEIAKEVNLAGESHLTGVVRTGHDIKKKWTDMRSRVKSKAFDIKRGKLKGSQSTLSYIEERVLQLIAKTSQPSGANDTLPPAYIHCFGKQKTDDYYESNSKFEDSNDSEDMKESPIKSIVNIDHVRPHVTSIKTEKSATFMTVPQIPIITFSNPIAVQAIPKVDNVEKSSETSIKNEESDDGDKAYMLQMMCESQRDIRRELKDIKRLLFNISKQKRKRLEQEDEKIQLKKMKLLLKCKKQGIDFDEFINDYI